MLRGRAGAEPPGVSWGPTPPPSSWGQPACEAGTHRTALGSRSPQHSQVLLAGLGQEAGATRRSHSVPPVPSCGSEGRAQLGHGLSRAPARDSKWHRVPAPSSLPCGLTMPAHIRVHTCGCAGPGTASSRLPHPAHCCLLAPQQITRGVRLLCPKASLKESESQTLDQGPIFFYYGDQS